MGPTSMNAHLLALSLDPRGPDPAHRRWTLA